MKSTGFFPFVVVLLPLGILESWNMEGNENDPIKIGACPSLNPIKCFSNRKSECRTDWECSGKKRCCEHICGAKCLFPVPIVRPVSVKPGNCNQLNGRCLVPTPSNKCQRDSQCEGNFKCCPTSCGKICFPPV